MRDDTSIFPDPVYRDTVLGPLFDGVKKHYASSMAAINQAHVVMLHNCDILELPQAHSIAKALQAIDDELDISALCYTGEHEDYFFLVESELKIRLGADLGGMLHTARSRNDMDHTVFKMVLRDRTDELLTLVLALASVLQQKIHEERDTLIVAYTHGQPAQPDTFAHYLAAVLEVLISDMQRIMAARELLDLCPMGAAAITTSGFAIDRQSMAVLLGFVEPKRNSYGCIASVDYITGLYSAIKLLFVHLGRVVQDMAFWSSFEVGQLHVPNALVQISSIMPQKRNPVAIEHMRHLASVSVGRCDMMINTMHNTPFTDMNDSEGEVQAAGYTAFESGGRVLKLFASFLQGVSIDGDRVNHNAERACITITELADTLVRDEHLSFRQAHEIAAATASEVIRQNITLQTAYAVFSEAYLQATGKATLLDETRFSNAVSMQYFVSIRDRFGGPGKTAMDEATAHYEQCISHLSRRIDTGSARLASADKSRLSAFKRLLEQ
ncbi:MAG: argininosuccinate lyase [Granulosicoccus sp.]